MRRCGLRACCFGGTSELLRHPRAPPGAPSMMEHKIQRGAFCVHDNLFTCRLSFSPLPIRQWNMKKIPRLGDWCLVSRCWILIFSTRLAPTLADLWLPKADCACNRDYFSFCVDLWGEKLQRYSKLCSEQGEVVVFITARSAFVLLWNLRLPGPPGRNSSPTLSFSPSQRALEMFCNAKNLIFHYPRALTFPFVVTSTAKFIRCFRENFAFGDSQRGGEKARNLIFRFANMHKKRFLRSSRVQKQQHSFRLDTLPASHVSMKRCEREKRTLDAGSFCEQKMGWRGEECGAKRVSISISIHSSARHSLSRKALMRRRGVIAPPCSVKAALKWTRRGEKADANYGNLSRRMKEWGI